MPPIDYPGHGLFLPYLVNKTATLINVRLQAILDAHGLTLTHWRVLAFLASQDGLTVGALAEATMTEQSTLSRSLRALEQRGFVARASSDIDNRALHVHLEAVGRKAFDEMLKEALALEAGFTKGISAKDLDVARSVLLRIIESSQP
jgi:DNA-binding MarR family transcriptional regulator